MIYLKDTCVFINKLNPTRIMGILGELKQRKEYLGITNIILSELVPGRSIPKDDAEKSRTIINSLEFMKKSKSYIEYNIENEDYAKNYKDIRKRYYGHLNDLNAVKKALQAGDITPESFKSRSYKNKDCGECSCIAVAMTNPKEFLIVSDDKGRVFLKPDINLFDKYKKSHAIEVLNYDDWYKGIYSENKEAN